MNWSLGNLIETLRNLAEEHGENIDVTISIKPDEYYISDVVFNQKGDFKEVVFETEAF